MPIFLTSTSSLRRLFASGLLALTGLGLSACSDPNEAPAATTPTASAESERPEYNSPLVEYGADPWVYRTEQGQYYFISTAPEFDRIELAKADTLNGLTDAEPTVIWHRPREGTGGGNVWAPELHRIDGVWYVHVALGDSDDPFRMRMHVLSNRSDNPMEGEWVEEGQIDTPWDSFALDATTFEHNGKRYLIWAQKDPEERYNSALYLAQMDSPTSIQEPVISISEPDMDWERVGYKVNEGAAVIKHDGRIFVTYSAAATDHNYAMGLLWADQDADLLDSASWKKSPEPVFSTNADLNRYGPGHNSFTLAEDGKTDLMVYHARNYKELRGSPLTDPNRHAHVRMIEWDSNGFPVFHQDEPDNYHQDGQVSASTSGKYGHAFVSREPFGELADGREVTRYTLNNGEGMEVKLMNYGGIITHLRVPDSDGNLDNVVLGFNSLKDYLEQQPPYFGALIGRYGNRIAQGRFELEGTEYELDQNDGDNHLHGGVVGFDKKLWDSRFISDERGPAVELTLLSEDGDQGYPGNLDVTVRYVLTDDNELLTEYRAETDKATPVNLTQHTYFNLSGKDDILDHVLQINADRYTPVDDGLIPTGELASVEGTAFDFTEPKPIGQDINADNAQLKLGGGYDHNYVLNRDDDEGRLVAARVEDPTSGRVLEVLTEEPGIQFYSGNFLDGTLSDGERTFERRGALCLEPQHYPDSPNQPDFPSTILEPGEVYETSMSYRFSVQ